MIFIHQHRCIYPYESEDRDLVLQAPFKMFEPDRAVFTCDNVYPQFFKNAMVSKGSCLGCYKGVPVYASIDGRIAGIEPKKLSYAQTVQEITVVREAHKQVLWGEIPFFENAGGGYFLAQMGIAPENDRQTARFIFIDGIEREPGSGSKYRLLIEQTVKIILGADALGRCYHASHVIFCIENKWPEIVYLLKKYLDKYKHVLSGEVNYSIQLFKRSYPLIINQDSENMTFPVQVALHAYNGYYEHMPALTAYITVKGPGRKPENIAAPVGTRVGSLPGGFFNVYEKGSERTLIVLNGPLGGDSVNARKAVLTPQSFCVSAVRRQYYDEAVCMQCGACESICPMHLTPNKPDKRTFEKCIGCGCCTYVCPANRRLSERIRHGRTAKANQSMTSSGKQRKSAGRGHYIEIAPEFSDFLPLQEYSDAKPHIHAGSQNRSPYLYELFAVLPMLLWSAAAYGTGAFLRLLLSAAVCSALNEILYAATGFGEKDTGRYSAILDGLLLALLLPQDAHLALIAGAGFFCIAFGRYGLLRYIYVDEVLLTAVLASVFAGTDSGIIQADYMPLFMLAGFFYLVAARQRYFLPSALFILPHLIFGMRAALSGQVLICGLFFTKRWQRGPSGRRQRLAFSLGAGVLSAVLSGYMGLYAGPFISIAAVNIIACILEAYTI